MKHKTILLTTNFIILFQLGPLSLYAHSKEEDFYSRKATNLANLSDTPTVIEFASYPKDLEDVLKILHSLPEMRELIAEVKKGGAIHCILDTNAQSGAYWDSHSRSIAVNPYMNTSDGSYITCLVFELHNAAADNQLVQLTDLANRGKISKESYVESIERVEYQNALKATNLLSKGIKLGIFPKESHWKVFNNFEDHYKVQQLTGHSDFIAAVYDRVSPRGKGEVFHGTAAHLKLLSEVDRKIYLKYLSVKNDLESRQEVELTRATRFLQNEYTQLGFCALGSTDRDCTDFSKKLTIMNEILGGHPVYEAIAHQ